MKTKFNISILFIIFLSLIFSIFSYANNPEWINYTNGNRLSALFRDKDIIWVGTYYGGLIKINSITNETIFYNKANSGLLDNYIKAIVTDKQGNKWLGTYSRGLLKFDGSNVIVFDTSNSELPYNDINALAIDSNGNLWIGTTFRGITKFDGNKFINYENTEINSQYINAIAIDEAGIWIGTSNSGMYTFNEKEWRKYSVISARCIYSIKIDLQGNKWVGTNNGLFAFGNFSLKNFNIHNSGLNDSIVWSIDLDKKGNIWIGTLKGLSKFDGNNWVHYNVNNSEIPANDIRFLNYDEQDKLWVGTFYNGLSYFDGTNWTKENTSNSGLTSNYFNDLKTDNKGNKWILTQFHKSLLQFDDTNWTEYIFSDLGLLDKPDREIRSIQIDKNDNLWLVAQYEGLIKFDGNNWTVFKKLGLRVPLFIDGSGNKWAFNYRKLVKFDDTIWSEFELPTNLDEGDVKSFAADSSGNIWLAAGSEGLWKFDGINWTEYTPFNSIFPYVYSILVDRQGHLWLKAENKIIRYDGKDTTVYHNIQGSLATIDMNNNIWFIAYYGVGYGLIKFDGKTTVNYSKTNSGLPENQVEFISIDKNDNKWIGTYDSGLSVFREGGVVSVENELVSKNGYTLLYPNPSSDFITLRIQNIEPVQAIQIIDIFGNRVLYVESQDFVSLHRIDISTLLPGVYFVKIGNDKPQKFIKL